MWIARANKAVTYWCVARLTPFILRFLRDEEGQDLIEYAIILSFVTLSVVGLIMGAGKDVKGAWAASNNQLAQANGGAS